jgi:hypothetical protein
LTSVPGKNHEVRLLVQRQEVLILIDDVERDRLGDQLADRLGRRDHLDLVPVARAVAGLDHAAVDLDQPLVDQALDPGARQVRDPVGQILVDSAGEVLGDREAQVLHVGGFFLVGFDFELIWICRFNHRCQLLYIA